MSTLFSNQTTESSQPRAVLAVITAPEIPEVQVFPVPKAQPVVVKSEVHESRLTLVPSSTPITSSSSIISLTQVISGSVSQTFTTIGQSLASQVSTDQSDATGNTPTVIINQSQVSSANNSMANIQSQSTQMRQTTPIVPAGQTFESSTQLPQGTTTQGQWQSPAITISSIVSTRSSALPVNHVII